MNDAITCAAPRGKRCTRCPCCDAVIIFDGEALCSACDDGTHPALDESYAMKPLPIPLTLPPSTDEAEIEDNPRKERITEDQINAIREAPPWENATVLSKRLGLKPHDIWYQRSKMRNEAKIEKPAAHPQHKPEERSTSQTNATRIGPGHAAAKTAQATFIVTDAICNNWWNRLKLGEKAAIFAGNYVIPIEGSVQ